MTSSKVGGAGSKKVINKSFISSDCQLFIIYLLFSQSILNVIHIHKEEEKNHQILGKEHYDNRQRSFHRIVYQEII